MLWWSNIATRSVIQKSTGVKCGAVFEIVCTFTSAFVARTREGDALRLCISIDLRDQQKFEYRQFHKFQTRAAFRFKLVKYWDNIKLLTEGMLTIHQTFKLK